MSEIDRLNRELEAQKLINESTYCAYCGERFPLDAPDIKENVEKHIFTCPKHPIAKLLAENARLKSTLKNIIHGAVDVRGMPAGSTYQELLITLTYAIEHARAALRETQEKKDGRT